MKTIKLEVGTWQFDPAHPLGKKGGMGAVFMGLGEKGMPVAIKRIDPSVADAGARELEVARAILGQNFANVIPIYDVGQFAGINYVVMARADRSLDDLVESSGKLTEVDALEIVDQIVSGLEQLGNYVHRDLKPLNVLSLNGLWKVADFGIAREAGVPTSPQTLKEYLSVDYAAPELWRKERATHATDVYAIGCILYRLLAGHTPFRGPNYMDQHLTQTPPDLSASSRVKQICFKCLAKSPDARPNLSMLRQLLRRAREPSNGIISEKLAAAGAVIAAENAAAEAKRVSAEAETQRHARILKDATNHFARLMKELFDEIRADASPAVEKENVITLGKASLLYSVFGHHGPISGGGWHIEAMGLISLHQENTSYQGLSANVVFGRRTATDPLQWWELSFMHRPTLNDVEQHGRGNQPEPFGFQGKALASQIAATLEGDEQCQLAGLPFSIDGREQQFYEKWKGYFADAALGKLQRPTIITRLG